MGDVVASDTGSVRARLDAVPRPNGPLEDTSSGVRSTLVQLAVLAAAWLVYRVVRLATSDQRAEAFSNARRVVEFQQLQGIDIEPGLQAVVGGSQAIIVAANWYYLAHFPVTIALVAVAFHRSRHRVYPVVRNMLLAVTSVGLVGHAFFPLAPPRMLAGFVDTAVTIGPNPYDLPGSGAANQFAAMPSMHVAWSVIVALGIFGLTTSRVWRAVAVLHPVLTTLTVLVTANHFLIDVVVAVALVAVIGTWLIRQRRRQDGQPDADLLPYSARHAVPI